MRPPADVVVEHSYSFPMVTHFAIEPHGFIAAPDGDGIAVWSSIQHPYWLQRIVAKLLGLPLSKVRVLSPRTRVAPSAASSTRSSSRSSRSWPSGRAGPCA